MPDACCRWLTVPVNAGKLLSRPSCCKLHLECMHLIAYKFHACQQANAVMPEQPVSDIALPLQATRHASRRHHAAATRCAAQMRSGRSRPLPPTTAAAGSPAGCGTCFGRRRPLGWMRKPFQWLRRPCARRGNAGRAPAQTLMLSPSPARSRSATMSQCTTELGPRSPARRYPADPPWARPGTGRCTLFRLLNTPARAPFCCFCSTFGTM